MPVRRGEIYFVNLNPVQGREQAGQRPLLVLSVDSINRLPLVVTVVVGTKGENVTRDYSTNVRVSTAESGLPKAIFLSGVSPFESANISVNQRLNFCVPCVLLRQKKSVSIGVQWSILAA
jgi:mRNA-degrading endonuclease toxin of MazEF toxin-antitoxin module